MAWMKGRAPHRWQMQRIDVDAPFRVQIEETPGAPPRSAGAGEGPGVLASKMRKSRCQIDKSSREWTSGVDVGPLAKPSAVAGSRLQSLRLSTPNRAHLSPPRRSPQTNTTRWTA